MTQARLPLGDPRLISFLLLGDLPLGWLYVDLLKNVLCQDLVAPARLLFVLYKCAWRRVSLVLLNVPLTRKDLID